MSIVSLDAPDFRTISDFRKCHLKALASLFAQVLRLQLTRDQRNGVVPHEKRRR